VAGAFDASYGTGGGLWLGHDRGLQVMDVVTGALRRVDPVVDGLPAANVTAILPAGAAAAAGDGGGLWLGTSVGVARRLQGGEFGGDWKRGEREWRFYGGNLWLPGSADQWRVTSLVPLGGGQQEGVGSGGGQMLVVSGGGLAVFEPQAWTLERKAAHYQQMAAPRHDRFGYASDCVLRQPGNLSAFELVDSDNDGLWTAMYTASQAFRFGVTGEAAARKETMYRFGALHFLFDAPAAPGTPWANRTLFPARSAVKDGAGPPPPPSPGGRHWNRSLSYPGWSWKADTSSDEITGHMYAGAPRLRVNHCCVLHHKVTHSDSTY
jgi:hypothetical protein